MRVVKARIIKHSSDKKLKTLHEVNLKREKSTKGRTWSASKALEDAEMKLDFEDKFGGQSNRKGNLDLEKESRRGLNASPK